MQYISVGTGIGTKLVYRIQTATLPGIWGSISIKYIFPSLLFLVIHSCYRNYGFAS